MKGQIYQIEVKAVRCPVCNQRVFDVVKGTNGSVEIKCPRCRIVSKIDLSFRMKRRNQVI